MIDCECIRLVVVSGVIAWLLKSFSPRRLVGDACVQSQEKQHVRCGQIGARAAHHCTGSKTV